MPPPVGPPAWPGSGPGPGHSPGPRRRALTLSIAAAAAGVVGVKLLLAFVVPLVFSPVPDRELTLPAQAGGLTRVDCPQVRALQETMVAELADEDFERPVVGAYGGSSCASMSAIVWGAAGPTGNPGRQVEAAFAEAGRSMSPPLAQTPYPAGGDGAVLRCGDLTGQGRPMVLCVWADRGAMFLTIVLDRPQAEAATLSGALREDVVRKG